MGSGVRLRFAAVYALVPLVVIAAAALATYSYRYADQLARRGEQAILATTEELLGIQLRRIEHMVVESDQTVFRSLDLDSLEAVTPKRWKELVQVAALVESVVILDDAHRIVSGTYHSKKRKAAAEVFRERLEETLLRRLQLDTLLVDEHRHLHTHEGGRYYLLAATRREAGGKTWFVVLEEDLTHLVAEVFPEYFAGVEAQRLFQVIDEAGAIVFGYPLSGIPEPYVLERRFPTTLTGWRIRMAPREAPALDARRAERRVTDLTLIALSALTIFVGLAVLTAAVRAERQANRLKSDFVANVSHELKTPLSLIRMFAELLATGRAKGPEAAREYAEIITRESDRLGQLIDNVLDFARIERGKAAFVFQRGDLGEVLTRALDVSRHRVEREGMRLVLAVDEALPQVKIDVSAMTLVAINLIDNAIKYAADGKVIEVALTHAGGRVTLEVRDHGPGIPDEERELVFERFYRARATRDRSSLRGSGIGLSLVRHIAEAHDGGVTLTCGADGGCAFRVWLPALAALLPESSGDAPAAGVA